MKRERALAIVICALVLLLVFRGVFIKPKGKVETLPASLDTSQPFFAVYFASPQGDQLLPEFRSGEGSVEQRLEALIEGPRSPGLIRTLPQKTQVLDYLQRGNLIIVNFNHHLMTDHSGGSTGEIMTVYSIVNTLVGSSGIERVQILVEHETIQTLAGHLDLGEPLTKDYALLNSYSL